MFSWLRIFIVCLLVLALPAQSMAAAMMIHCGVSHQRMYGAESPHTASRADHHDEGARSVHADHRHQATVTAPVDEVANAGHATAQDGTYKCAACASCCSAAALPVLALGLPEPHPFSDWEAAPIHAVIGFVTAAPERPPRPFLA